MLPKFARDYHERVVRRFDVAVREGDYRCVENALGPWALWSIAIIAATMLVVRGEVPRTVIGLSGVGIIFSAGTYLIVVYLRVTARVRADVRRERGNV